MSKVSIHFYDTPALEVAPSKLIVRVGLIVVVVVCLLCFVCCLLSPRIFLYSRWRCTGAHSGAHSGAHCLVADEWGQH